MREQDRIFRQLQTHFGIPAEAIEVHPHLGTAQIKCPGNRIIDLLHMPARSERSTPHFKVRMTCPLCDKPCWSEPVGNADGIDRAAAGEVKPDGQHLAVCTQKPKHHSETEVTHNEEGYPSL
jgi:hypothetical protein